MIFYLSGTGNTKWAAEYISNVTHEQLINITEVINGDCAFMLQEDERIGFCFPVHGWRPPLLVRKFIEKLNISNPQGHYTFALCTAGDTIGETMDIFNNDIKKRNIHLDSTFSLIMPESYVGLPFMDVDKPEKEKKKKTEAERLIASFAQHISDRVCGVNHLDIGRWPKINSRIIGGYFTNRLITDKPFYVDKDKCIKCGKCESVCQVDNITKAHDTFPEWKHNGNCMTCFACYHHCPTHAIEFGRRTKKKGQYWYGKNK